MSAIEPFILSHRDAFPAIEQSDVRVSFLLGLEPANSHATTFDEVSVDFVETGVRSTRDGQVDYVNHTLNASSTTAVPQVVEEIEPRLDRTNVFSTQEIELPTEGRAMVVEESEDSTAAPRVMDHSTHDPYAVLDEVTHTDPGRYSEHAFEPTTGEAALPWKHEMHEALYDLSSATQLNDGGLRGISQSRLDERAATRDAVETFTENAIDGCAFHPAAEEATSLWDDEKHDSFEDLLHTSQTKDNVAVARARDDFDQPLSHDPPNFGLERRTELNEALQGTGSELQFVPLSNDDTYHLEPLDPSSTAQIIAHPTSEVDDFSALLNAGTNESLPEGLVDSNDPQSLWEDMFADDDVLLEDVNSQSIIAAQTQEQNAPSSVLAGEASVEDFGGSHGVQPHDISWNNAPDLHDFLAEPSNDTDVPLTKAATEQAGELRWDDAFANDNDFLIEDDMVPTLSTSQPANNIEALHDASQSSRQRSSSIRQSYIPPGQTSLLAAASTPQQSTKISAVPQPAMPVSNTVESSVRATSNYASPYDMPDDFAKPLPRKRTGSGRGPGPITTQPSSAQNLAPPPARVSSVPVLPASHQAAQANASFAVAQQGFFEDLPVIPRQKSNTPIARYGPLPEAMPQVHSHAPTMLASHTSGSFESSTLTHALPILNNMQHKSQQPSMPSVDSPPVANLQAPARLAPYADEQNTLRSATVPPPQTISRYSPAPAAGPISLNQSRYNQPLSRPSLQQYAPRTSSPLSYQSISQSTSSDHIATSREVLQGSTYPSLNRSHSTLEAVQETTVPNYSSSGTAAASSQTAAREGPQIPLKSSGSSVSGSPRKRSMYNGSIQPSAPHAGAPKRSTTSSPNGSVQLAAMSMNQRLTSAEDVFSAPTAKLAFGQSPLLPRTDPPHAGQIIPPQDDRAADPLQRWRGHPLVSWGNGGMMITAFPSYLPRYIPGQAHPLMQPGGGHFKVQSASGSSLLADQITKFPGPLKKSKKKELLLWLQSGIDKLFQYEATMTGSTATPQIAKTKLAEHKLLWQVLALAVEHDGNLDGSSQAANAIKQLLSEPQMSADDLVASAENTPSKEILSDAPASVELGPLRSFLKTGEAEKAVWHAVDQRLWGPAFLISSTLSKDIWKQVIQEFVRKEVRDKALAALFQVFAGNWDESVDELVSVSARAGFQMVKTAIGAPNQADALAGLENWKETVLLILSNRSPGDSQALLAIGRVLAGYGRYEAAHVCFIFAGMSGLFGGFEDSNAAFTLVGSNQALLGSDFDGDIESILLSEVYEYLLAVGPAQAPCVPHLQAYKLYHAEILAENGHRTKASQYCDSINTTIHSKTNRSPYYNVALMQSVDTLHKRLSETPIDSANSWRPSIDKVSSSLWGKFNSFVAGEDNADGSPQHSGTPPDSEHFQRFADTTPSVAGSPAAATFDTYGNYLTGAVPVPSSTPPAYGTSGNPHMPTRTPSGMSNSRYLPNAISTRTSLDSPRRPGLEPLSVDGEPMSPRHGAGVSNSSSAVASLPYSPNKSFTIAHQNRANTIDPQLTNGSFHQTSQIMPNGMQINLGLSQRSMLQQDPEETPKMPSSAFASYPSAGPDDPIGVSENTPASSTPTYGAGDSSYSSSYQPYDYETSYATTAGNERETPRAGDEIGDIADEPKPRKKTFMDDDEDDDDLMKRVAALKIDSAPSGTREPDDAVRRAAEADAARPSPALNHKSSWFGGLNLFGKRQSESLDQKKAVKANLGEKSTFVFDPELKKWVNKAAGAATTSTPTATPPPPKSTPSRSATPALTPASSGPMGPPRPTSSFGSAPPMSRTASFQSHDSRPPTSGGPSLAPPVSRPSTAASNASDLDDFLGSAGPRSRGGARSKKKGRYVDVMANKAT